MSGHEDDEEKKAPAPLFPYDEMSEGVTMALQRRADYVTGRPPDETPTPDPSLLSSSGRYPAYKPTAPARPSNRPGTGSFAAFTPRPTSPTQPSGTTGAFKALSPQQPRGTTGSFAPLNPQQQRGGTGNTPAFSPKPTAPQRPAPGGTGAFRAMRPTSPGNTGSYKAFRPDAASDPDLTPPPEDPHDEVALGDEDDGRLQTHIRALALTDSAVARAQVPSAPRRPPKLPPSAAEDTFVKQKMKQAEQKVPDFDLDEDLG